MTAWILSLLTEIEPLLAPSAAADPTTLDLRWSVLARWAMVQIELDRVRWLAALAGDPTPASRERARAAIELGESLHGRLQRHDRLYAQRSRLAADPHGFVEATGRLARTLRRMVTMAVQTCAGGVGGLASGPGAGLPTGLAGRSGGGPRGGLRVRPGPLLDRTAPGRARSHQAANSPTNPRRNASTQITRIKPVTMVTDSPIVLNHSIEVTAANQ